MKRFGGKTAVVTGGGQGIGRQIALRLACEGAAVCIGDVNCAGAEETVRLIEGQCGGTAKAVPADICDELQVKALVESARSMTGEIDILVNNSGIAGPMKAVEDITAREWDETMAVNVRGMFFCCKYAVPWMKRRKNGVIVNIASVTGKRALIQRSPYAASKMAVIGFTRTLAAELGEWGIRVNAVCPGPVAGPRIEKVFEGIMARTGKSREEAMDERLSLTVLRQFVDPEDVAAAVAFLCSDDALKMTGQDINVSAGSLMY